MSAYPFSSWLRRWRTSPKARDRREPRKNRQHPRLALEELETRITPAILNPLGSVVDYQAAGGEANKIVLAHTDHFVGRGCGSLPHAHPARDQRRPH
jgi:hypothetical protein